MFHHHREPNERLLRNGSAFLVLVMTLCLPPAFAQSGVKKRRPLPDEFGNVVMNNFAQQGSVAPVIFRHWTHRAKFTCRLCHVDIGFAMEPNGTRMHEDDNRKGFYCGACHNGKTAFSVQGTKAGGADTAPCDRCHAPARNPSVEARFTALAAQLPKGRFGNNIDWEAAEIEGKIELTDTLPDISVKRRPLEIPKDYTIEAKMTGLPEIIFSHKKHAIWSGCELCHPDIFAVKTGGTKFTMEDVFAGKYCGLCHDTVAFPAIDCQRCHVKPVAR